ncbi:MAG: toll/interleukin-1 receptor domain-containing protein [Candidatus Korobacteraceae bacterium]
MSAIFISYRREDSEDSARALYESLIREFGKERLFMDVEAIALGSDFRTAVEHSLDDCGVFLVVIGPTWLDVKATGDPQGQRRLDNPSDYVRQEVATALKRGPGLPVIPVLVHGAGMPVAANLPDDLKDLAYRNALALSHLDWDGNLQKLVAAIRPHVNDGKAAPQSSSEVQSILKHGVQVQKLQAAGVDVQASSAMQAGSAIEIGSAANVKVGKGVLIGVPVLVLAAIVAYFVLRPGPRPNPNPGPAGMAITIVRNSRLTGETGPVNFMVDGEQQGQIRFDDHGNTPIQIHASEGEHQFTISNPQTKATCAGTFQASADNPKLVLRMRDNGTVCSLQPLTKADTDTQ